MGTVEAAEKEKGSIWPGSAWEVKDRKGVYTFILYRGEFAMSRGVIISTKQTRCFYRDELQDESDPRIS